MRWSDELAAKVSMISCVGGVGIPSNLPETCWLIRIQNPAPCMTMTTKSKHVKMLPCTSFRSSECSAEICTVSFTLPGRHQGQGSGVSSCANSKWDHVWHLQPLFKNFTGIQIGVSICPVACIHFDAVELSVTCRDGKRPEMRAETGVVVGVSTIRHISCSMYTNAAFWIIIHYTYRTTLDIMG